MRLLQGGCVERGTFRGTLCKEGLLSAVGGHVVAVLKTADVVRRPGVRIPPHPLRKRIESTSNPSLKGQKSHHEFSS